MYCGKKTIWMPIAAKKLRIKTSNQFFVRLLLWLAREINTRKVVRRPRTERVRDDFGVNRLLF
jgi:hypothetical protein